MAAEKVVSSSSEVKSFALYLAVIGLSIAFYPAQALGQTSTAPPPMEGTTAAAPTTPPPAAMAGPRMVGGHIGVATPLVTFHFSKPAGTKTTTSISDQFTLAVPIGISVHLSPDWVFDFETIFANDVKPWGGTGFTVDPGVVNVSGPVALGLRIKFDAAANANFGIIPLANKGIMPVGDGMWFIEGALPITATKTQGMTVGVVLHTGIGF